MSSKIFLIVLMLFIGETASAQSYSVSFDGNHYELKLAKDSLGLVGTAVEAVVHRRPCNQAYFDSVRTKIQRTLQSPYADLVKSPSLLKTRRSLEQRKLASAAFVEVRPQGTAKPRRYLRGSAIGRLILQMPSQVLGLESMSKLRCVK